MQDKTEQQKAAGYFSEAPETSTFDNDRWVESLKHHFNLARQGAADKLTEQRHVNARINFGQAAVYAGMLALYYEGIGDTEQAAPWRLRATRYTARAFVSGNEARSLIVGKPTAAWSNPDDSTER